jgi:predicted nuclease of predicted toxin-antitoxin system
MLRNDGFDIDYVLELIPGAEDEAVLEMAYSQQRILITQDKDFGELVFRLHQPHHGIVLIRLEGYTPQFKAEIVTRFLQQHEKEMLDKFTVIQPNAIRIRK